MLNIELLDKQLTLAEFEAGRDLFNLLRERGFGAHKAAGIIYRAGYLAGKKAANDRTGREINRLHKVIDELKNSPPEAIKEGSDTDE